MDNKLQHLIAAIKKLEKELSQEIDKKEAEFFYKIQGKKVRFDEEIKRQHKLLATRISRYVKEAELLNILTIPFIWACLLPALLLDALVSLFQAVCFPVYCGYFNGLIAYTHEIAGRTEQYWCPIKHARRTSGFHSRYSRFLEYGDAQGYREELYTVRHDFEDLLTVKEDEEPIGKQDTA